MSRTAPVEMPPHRALLIVDVKDFSTRPGRYHAELTDRIPLILRQAFQRCGLVDMWDETRFSGGTGDGYYLGFTSMKLPLLLNPFLPALQEELDYRNTLAAAEAPMRMRVSVQVGPMTDDSISDLSTGSGDARVQAHRLLDAEPVRDLLTRSTHKTCVAAIVSQAAYANAVQGGYTGESPDDYVATPVRVKQFEGIAYLRVPTPTGDLLKQGFVPAEAPPAAAVAEKPGANTSNTMNFSGASGTFVGVNQNSTNHGKQNYRVGHD
ncbi:hypothetical protein [Actinokineospora spheciospongiae]|uniref:hypothetical protein n=1 Tax=Actinokineospora spheciospongiae TaxID=909613 RepID=UPI000D9167CC|nr:hypothetical protein [Actinokineospora spheciospongiae]PWW64725.1 hypothetical protein DFQ13_103699 [Actinokineospora spheciospongiae]